MIQKGTGDTAAKTNKFLEKGKVDCNAASCLPETNP